MTTPQDAPQADGSVWMARRLLAAALMAALVMVGVALVYVIGVEDYPPAWVPTAQAVAALLVFVLCDAVDYRTPAIAPGTSPEHSARSSLQASQATMFLRFALCEALALISAAAAFVIRPESAWTYIDGAVFALVLMAVHVWPNERQTRKLEASLEREGGTSHLRTAMAG